MLSSFNEALQNDKWFDRTSSVEYKTITFTEKSKLMLFLLLAQAIRSIEKKITQHKELIQWFSTRNGLPLPQDIFKC